MVCGGDLSRHAVMGLQPWILDDCELDAAPLLALLSSSATFALLRFAHLLSLAVQSLQTKQDRCFQCRADLACRSRWLGAREDSKSYVLIAKDHMGHSVWQSIPSNLV